MKKRRAILYVRVSTDEQAEKGYSLAHQEERLRNNCLINNIDIIGFYKEDHSAKTFERPEFKRLLEFLKKNKDCADLLLFLKWDRFSRNAPEAYSMIKVLGKYNIEAQAIEQPLDISVPENKIMLAVYLTTPEVENDRRSLNVIAGMRRALKDGRWLGVAPKGYKNTRDDSNKPIIVPGKDAELIKYAFEQMATGHFNVETVRRMVTAKGLKITKNGFWHLMRNCLYTGRIVVAAYKDEPGIIVKGKHEPLISDSVFYDAQTVIDGRKRIGVPAHYSRHEDLPLRGFLKCIICNKNLTGSAANGNGGKYYYYHCTCGCKERFRATVANQSFGELMHKLSHNEKIVKSYQIILADYFKNYDTVQGIELQKINRELEIYRNRLENAQTLMLDCQIEAADYRNMKAKIDPEIDRLIRYQIKTSEKNPEEMQVIEFGLYYLCNMGKLFTTATLEQKYRMIGSTFPKKLVFEKGQVRTIGEEEVPTLLIKPGTDFRNKKTQGQNKSDPEYNRVIWIGFEPMTLSLEG